MLEKILPGRIRITRRAWASSKDSPMLEAWSSPWDRSWSSLGGQLGEESPITWDHHHHWVDFDLDLAHNVESLDLVIGYIVYQQLRWWLYLRRACFFPLATEGFLTLGTIWPTPTLLMAREGSSSLTTSWCICPNWEPLYILAKLHIVSYKTYKLANWATTPLL